MPLYAQNKLYTCLGFMSGTSLDGVDAAIIQTDGIGHVTPGPHVFLPYPASFQKELRQLIQESARLGEARDDYDVAARVSHYHLSAAQLLLKENPVSLDVVGFHGQTIFHDPQKKISLQIGDPEILADYLKVPVVSRFRQKDLDGGGQGAPLVPVFHQMLARALPKPVAFLNIGGISNVTWCGHTDQDLIAFDAGPGNGLLNDWMMAHLGMPFDKDGALAARGAIRQDLIDVFMQSPFFDKIPPKSLDRCTFDLDLFEGLSPSEGAATLTRLSAQCLARAATLFPEPVRAFYLCGGGRLNTVLRAHLSQVLSAPTFCVEELSLNGDFMEAQAFAYLAVRTLQGLPLSYPGTTGVNVPTVGGEICYPKDICNNL